MALIAIMVLGVAGVFTFEILHPNGINQEWGTVRICGYNKALVTLVKYFLQVYLNFTRKSTVGWSLLNVMLDFAGGAFSFLQLLVDSVARGKPLFGDGTDQGFNIVKFILSILTMGYDMIFLF